MRIEGLLDPVISRFQSTPPPAVAFGDLVGDPGAGVVLAVATDRALGFQALGMFGLCGAVGGGETDAISGLIAPVPRAPPLAHTGPQISGRRLEVQGRGSGATEILLTDRGDAPAVASRAALFSERLAIVSETPFDPVRPDAPDLLESKASSRPEGPSRSPGRAVPAASVQVRVMSGEAGSAAVIVTAPSLSFDEVERFRERAEALLREHGLALDKVAVNGEGDRGVNPLGRGHKP